jgi:Cys-tRNA(Pro) deacylase
VSETRGTTALRRAGIEHRLMRYAYTADGGALQAAADLGVEPARMFKSLVARAGDELVFALVAADAVLSPKKLAAAAGAKHAVMADPREAERATGYQVGGISPLGSGVPGHKRRGVPAHLPERRQPRPHRGGRPRRPGAADRGDGGRPPRGRLNIRCLVPGMHYDRRWSTRSAARYEMPATAASQVYGAPSLPRAIS